ncbi:hypothetical protein [Pseudonocardia acidicola]|uniref:Uncharacterized protein n=1 Tax=Pseudonocardia acidicola TaxID=2724939 RepID=A0ABX1S687_9PSEU|nr:hypothetical protein [Pseudonocardia acidicola]NMH96117.1 hypothetical protein [Pseudonocardia acidicola]
MTPAVASFCGAAVNLQASMANPPQIDPTASPDQVKATVQAYGAQVEPLLAKFQQTATDPARADVTSIVQRTRAAFAAGDLTTLNTADFNNAQANLNRYMLGNCGYPQISVTASDNRYQGLPATVAAGNTAFMLSNVGTDVHELQLARVAVGDTETLDQLLSLTGQQYAQKITLIGDATADPGQITAVFAALTPGRYVVADFVPQGTKPGTDGTGPQHYLLGMKGEFTVQ